jgi:Arc/MetJ family transcription regulator
MDSHMKTTIEISDALMVEAKKIAAREGITARTLIEQELRHALSQRRQHGRFRLRKATFNGRGLSSGARGVSWQQLRELAYEGRGG